jgi:hypothetical protein
MFQSYTSSSRDLVKWDPETDKYTYTISIVDDDFTEVVKSTPANVLLDGWVAMPAAATAVVQVYSKRNLPVVRNLFRLFLFIEMRTGNWLAFDQCKWCLERLPECSVYRNDPELQTLMLFS